MNLVAKLALTVVMLAIGAAPALSLHSDTFLPRATGGLAGGPAPTTPSAPQADPIEPRDDPAAETGLPGIPQSDAEWADWMSLRTGEDAAADPSDVVEVVEEPVGEPETAGWVWDEAAGGWVYDEPEAVSEAPVADESAEEGGLLGILG